MSDGSNGVSPLKLVTSGVDLDEAAQRVLEDGAAAEVLIDLEEFLHALDSDPSARDRALLLVERTRLLAERGAARGRTSDQLRAQASRVRGDDDPAAVTALRVLRHELSTPVTVARSSLELLVAGDQDRATTDQLVEMALRSLRLAERLLQTWGRAEQLQAGPPELAWGRVDLGELVRQCAADVRAVLSDPRAVDVSVDRDVVVPADADAVRQILFNLLTNAAKFSPAGSRVEIGVTASAEHVDVAVRDRGPGVPARDVARIFDAGLRLDPDVPGTGIGLFVARQLARAHGGELSVEDVSGGARFVLRLPTSDLAWQQSLERREDAAAGRDAGYRERDSIADARDAELDQREEVATERDIALGTREALAREREAGLERPDRPSGDGRSG